MENKEYTFGEILNGKPTIDKKIENAFTYHPPTDEQAINYGVIRSIGASFASYLVNHCPESNERSIAITKIEEAVMWANASIARNS